MQEEQRTVKVAINPYFVDKQPLHGDSKYFAEGWENHELTLDDFATCIRNGWAYCSQLDGKRNTNNFLRSNVVSVDIDEGMTISEALENPFAKKHLSLLYTSASHSPTHPRFRLVFLLAKEITDPIEQNLLNRAVTRLFTGDESAVDPCRIFYGSTQAEPQVFSGMVDEKTLEMLLDIGKKSVADSKNKKAIATRQSSHLLDRTFEIKTAQGQWVQIGSIQQKTQVMCPFHRDQHSSAFVSLSERNSTFLHCLVCKSTHWVRNEFHDKLPTKQPLDFVETFRAIATNDISVELHPLLSEVDPQSITVNFLDEKFFSLPELTRGLTFVRSPKGSGKTSSLIKVLMPLFESERFGNLQAYEEANDDSYPVEESDFRVLLIGHRKALIRDLCNRLKLNCYLDKDPSKAIYGKHRKQRFGVCLDSLNKVSKNHYDLIIIDEVEQVLAHFLSDTIGKEAEYIFKLFAAMIASTPYVIGLDADLDWNSFTTLHQIKHRHSIKRTEQFSTTVFINEFLPAGKSVKLYASKNQLLTELLADIEQGKRCFVSSNSKNWIASCATAIDQKFHKAKETICITSDNSQAKPIQQFIENIKVEARRYDVILSSPSLGTGVDITFDDDAVEIDVVYGFYEALINTHTDIDQQLGRVRHPGEAKVWITHRQFQFETEFDVVREDLISENVAPSAVIDIDPWTRKESVDKQNPFLVMAAQITTRQRTSKNNLRQNFIDYKRQSGWNIDFISKDDELHAIGNLAIKSARQHVARMNHDELLSARSVDMSSFFKLKDLIEDNEAVSKIEQLSYRKTSMEQFYCQPLSREIIDRDGIHGFRRAVRMYELLTNRERFDKEFPEHSRYFHPDYKLSFQLTRNKVGAAFLLLGLLNTLPCFANGVFDSSIEYSIESLQKFSEVCLEYKPYLEAQFDIEVRKDIMKNPTQQANAMLSLVGLCQRRTRTAKIDGKKVYFYCVDQDSIDRMNSIVKHRDHFRSDPWIFVHHHNGFPLLENRRDDPNFADGDEVSLAMMRQLQRIHRTPFPRKSQQLRS